MAKTNFTRMRYRDLIKHLTIEPTEYAMLQRAFQGGFTHANPFFSNKTVEDVTSFDFTSSYPAVMVAEKFPMGKGEFVKIRSRNEFEENLKYYFCVFDVIFEELESKIYYDSYISESRCVNKIRVYANNGRIVSADKIQLTITGEDFEIIKTFYTWSKIKIGRFIRYIKGYLPTDFVKAVLKLYADKTTLKGVEGKEVEYLQSKEMLNSCYGMAVTNIIRPEHPYNDEWLPDETPNLEIELKKYNNSYSRFMFYPWGVSVPTLARKNLFTGIVNCNYDYIYSDTDSIKIRNAEKHKKYFDDYNNTIIDMLERACAFHKIPVEMVRPKTIKGIEKPLGVWDFDGHYKRFKTLGAKRYMVEYDDGTISITVSGLNKKVVIPYLCTGWYYDIKTRKEHNTPFAKFSNQLEIPADYTGKLTHTYIDDEINGTITDYLGNKGEFHERSFIHLEKAEYSLSMAQAYIDYLLSLESEDNPNE